MAVTERFDWADGAPTRPNFVDYKPPTAAVMPRLHVEFADSYEPTGPFGAKGVGEIALDPVPSLVASAVADAVGVRIHELPITAEKVFWGMRSGPGPVAVPVDEGAAATTAYRKDGGRDDAHRGGGDR
jgi:CO/xanthine dehydrogenase Mo-binding subunit